jgi:DNA repair photolyase
LSKPGYVCKPIALGINTDAYQPLERRLMVTRSILEVLTACRHPLTIVTKSALIVRDLELLKTLAADGLISVMLSITSLDDHIKRSLEPRAASAAARLRVIEQLASAGVPVGVMVAPVIPAITDHEMEMILRAAHGAGATCASYVLLRLPHEVGTLPRARHTCHVIDPAITRRQGLRRDLWHAHARDRSLRRSVACALRTGAPQTRAWLRSRAPCVEHESVPSAGRGRANGIGSLT